MGRTSMLLACSIVPVLASCASNRVHEWTEEVQLSSGAIMVASRASYYRPINDIGGGRGAQWLLVKSTISGVLPPRDAPASFEGPMTPIMLDVLGPGVAYLVGVPTALGTDEWKVPPREFYVAFRLADDGWQRISLEALPLSAVPNLLLNERDLFSERVLRSGDHVDRERKRTLDADPTISKRFKTIVRSPTQPANR